MIFSKFAEIDGKVEIEIPSDSSSNRRQSSCWKKHTERNKNQYFFCTYFHGYLHHVLLHQWIRYQS